MNVLIHTCHLLDEPNPDDVDGGQEPKPEDMRRRFVEWDPLRDVSEAIDRWPGRGRRRRQRQSRWQRAARRRGGRR